MAVVATGAALVITQRRVHLLHREFGRRMLLAQDEERAWVAREVHDDMVQRLAVLRHELGRYRTAGPLGADQLRQHDGLDGEIADLSEALRRLAHRLHPTTLDHGDPRLAMEQLALEALRLHGIEVELHLDLPGRLRRPGLTLTLYRIGQEALRNVGRHAGTTRAALALRTQGEWLELTVRDRGRGFDPQARLRAPGRLRDGLGLLAMVERAEQAGGSTTVTAAPGAGVLVTVRLPIGTEEA